MNLIQQNHGLWGLALTGWLFAWNARAADWPQWRGPNRDGISQETVWLTQWPANGLKQLWKFEAGTGCSSVAVSGGRLFTMGNQKDEDTVWCLDAATGKVFWQHSYPAPLDAKLYEGGPNATPTVVGDHVYTVGKRGQLFCLRADNGTVVWSKNLHKDLNATPPEWGYAGSPLALGNLLILDVGGDGTATVALDKTTGDVYWKNGDTPAGYGSLMPFSFQGRSHLASFAATGLVVRDATSGKEIARHNWKTSYYVNAATPIIEGGKIFISSGYNKGCALLQLHPDALSVVWENRKMRNQMNSCVLWQGYLYGFDESTLTCLEFATGEMKWTQEGLGKGALMVASGKLIIQTEKGDLVLAELSPTAYQELSRTKALNGRCWVVPVLANRRLYAKNNKGTVVCLDVSR